MRHEVSFPNRGVVGAFNCRPLHQPKGFTLTCDSAESIIPRRYERYGGGMQEELVLLHRVQRDNQAALDS